MSTQNNQNNQSNQSGVPDAELLAKRKETIQAMYQAQDGVAYPLVSDPSLLSSLSTEELAKSYIVLWSQYIADAASKSSVPTFQLNCLLHDLCCRAKVLHGTYTKYLHRPPTHVPKRPFHAWITSIVSKGPDEIYAHAGKKSILQSFPINEQKRNRIIDLVSKHDLGILACEETVCVGTVADMTDSAFNQFDTALNDEKEKLSSAFDTSSINEAFESIAAKSLYSNGSSTTTGKVTPLSNNK